MAWNITIHEHALTGTDQEFYFALQGIDMYAGKWNAAYYNMLKNIYSSKSGSLRVLQLPPPLKPVATI
jgi:hypothetical protein